MPVIRYRLAMPRPSSHLFHVEVEIDGLTAPHVDLVMPAWTPGSYARRDFARHVQDFSAGGLDWTKVDASRWRVEAAGRSHLKITYRVFAFELEVDRSHLDSTHGYFNGASLFMYVDGAKHVPVTLEIRAPRGWRTVTGLRRLGPGRYAAADYDELLDCPADVGTAPVKTFTVRGKPHRVLVHGRQNWGHSRMVRDLKRIVEVQAAFFGGLPYDDYAFLFYAASNTKLGGLEHRNSTAIALNPWIGKPAKSYERLVEIASHEFFHAWNVKRIRPKALGPFDYERGSSTRLLWLAEGVTSYYDDLFCERAGLYPAGRYLEKLAEAVRAYREKPSRLRQSLSASSFDTWLWGYEGDPNSVNRFMSYYEKGALVALCLDLEIRSRTRNRRSLDDVMRHLWKEHGARGRSLDEDEVRPVVERVAGGSYRDFFARYVDGVDEVPFERFLARAGLELGEKEPAADDPDPALQAWIGVATTPGPERPRIASVTEGGPAWRDGLSAGDELLALDGAKVANDTFAALLKDVPPGKRARFAVFRGTELLEIPVRVASRTSRAPALRPLAAADELQRAIFKGWTGRAWKPGAKRR